MRDVMKLCWAASQGDLDEIRRMVAKGVNLDEADYDGRTCIHLAASEGHSEVVKYLLGKKVNVSPEDRWGGTPMDDAKRHGQQKVIDVLENQLSN
ncbi:MAG: ankyrin repeat domain-containing protein [Candidatus Margulisbacteria bacterium]|nr:ankyrin repeat domain-containing protein [Candidatus Margulisiibacteriota bacterium]